jgi:hypothetical protein
MDGAASTRPRLPPASASMDSMKPMKKSRSTGGDRGRTLKRRRVRPELEKRTAAPAIKGLRLQFLRVEVSG